MTRVTTRNESAPEARRDWDVLIVGAGLSGLCMGARLRQAGLTSFLIIEKAGEVGGTWRDNRYPGCACDVPSHLYSLSFAQKPDWTRLYPSQPELFDYVRDVADRHALRPHIRFNTAMARAHWDAAAALWRVTTSAGETISARILVSGVGALHVPAYPPIPGRDSFAGLQFHSAEWPADCDLSGRRVAVIGTGASAAQFVPEIAPKVAALHLFQRTPPWVLPKVDRPITAREQWWLRHMPLYRLAFRARLYWLFELRATALNGNAKLNGKAQGMAERHLRRQVADPALRARLTPDYRIGCKRILISNDYYPTLGRGNVELVTLDIAAISPDGIVGADGVERRVDTIIHATGFEVTEALRRLDVTGRNGLELRQAWQERIETYYGITVSGFPNFFMLLGPNTALGHNSVVLMIEAQVRWC